LFNRINENAEVSYVNEDSEKIRKQDSGLSRYVWIGPYENTNHYLRLKIQTPKSSLISEEWASLSIKVDKKGKPVTCLFSFLQLVQ
jgi:hypothetical protein